MKLELSDLNNGTVLIGDKLVVRSKFIFDEDTSILWSGVRLITHPPCKKELQIAKEEIFTSSNFEAGEYIRDKPILIRNNVVPTIKKRNLEYQIQLILRQKNPVNPDEDLIIKRIKVVEITEDKIKNRHLQSNPIAFSISGLNVNLTKDIFKPGETIKINYSSQNLRELEIRLLQKANLVCYCEIFGENCSNIDELPPAIAGDSKTSNTQEGYLLLKVPEVAEPTHNHLWESISEIDQWGMKFGDYTDWSLLIIGRKRVDRNLIKFEIPITIVTKTITDGSKDLSLFSTGVTGGMNIFDGISSKFQKRFQLVSIDSSDIDESEIKEFKIKLKNISNNDLKGITIKLTGLQEGLFESGPKLLGFQSWVKGELKEIIYDTKQNISAIVSIIEDNSQNSVRIQTPISF